MVELRGVGLGRPHKCRLPRFCLRRIVIFPAEVGQLWGDEEPDSLWIVRVRLTKVFLYRRKSRSLPTEFVWDAGGDFGGVRLFLVPSGPLLNQEGEKVGT